MRIIDLNLEIVAVAALVFLLAGTVKGTTGIGLPMVAIGILTQFFDPRLAIALIMLPMIVTNFWQLYRAGEILRAARTYIWFIVALIVFVAISSSFATSVSASFLTGATGVAVVIFALINLLLKLPALADAFDRPAQVTIGAIAGAIGGLTAIWGPPMAMYLAARRVDKDEFVRATGLMITMGSMPLLYSYVSQGLLTKTLALTSAAMILPALAGFAIGEALRQRLSPEKFRLVLLWFFLVMGANLIRRSLAG